MENNKLLAEALLDIAKNSETTFIEATDDKELIESAKKLGIVLPSPDLAVLKTIYAEIDKVNRNGVVLPRKAVEAGLSTLVGKQINWEHNGAGRICGYIIDAQVKDDKIEITGVIFKSLFPEEMEQVKEKFNDKDLCVSFEIWNRNPENGELVIHDLENGFRSIDPIIFHGCGLLLVNPPACPKAKVYKLVAKVLKETEKIIDKVFGEDLIFASSAIEESRCKSCTTCNCEKEEPKLEEVILEEAKKKLCSECQQPLVEDETDICAKCKKLKAEQSSEIIQTEVKSDETKTEEKSEVAETKTEETKVEVKEEATIVTTTQETTKVDETTPGTEVVTTEVKTEQTVVNDEGKEVQKVEEEIKTVITYTFEQVQEAVNASTEELVAALPKEVSDRIKELVKDGKSMKEAMKQAWEEFKSKASEEKDKEIAKLQQELDKFNQEIEKVKIEEAKAKEVKPTLTVGSVGETIEHYKELQDKVNQKAFGHK